MGKVIFQNNLIDVVLSQSHDLKVRMNRMILLSRDIPGYGLRKFYEENKELIRIDTRNSLPDAYLREGDLSKYSRCEVAQFYLDVCLESENELKSCIQDRFKYAELMFADEKERAKGRAKEAIVKHLKACAVLKWIITENWPNVK